MLLKDSPYLPRGECRVVDAVLNGDVASGRGTVVLVQQEAEQVLQHNAGPRTYLYRTSRQCHAQRGSDAGRSDSEEEEEGWRCPPHLGRTRRRSNTARGDQGHSSEGWPIFAAWTIVTHLGRDVLDAHGLDLAGRTAQGESRPTAATPGGEPLLQL